MTALTTDIVALPSQFDGHAMARTVAKLLKSYPLGIPAGLVLDLSSIQFIRPTAVVFLSNFCDWMGYNNSYLRFQGCNCGSDAVSYLDDSGFFEHHLGKRLNSRSRVRDTTQPLRKIVNAEVHGWLELTLIPWLSTRLGLSKAALFDFKTCISEIFNNIQDHSGNPVGSIFVQHFPRENSVIISMADWGVGIPSTVRRKAPHMSDEQAIIQATREGFSAKSKPTNRGAGLPLLIDKVVLQNHGAVTIYSYDGIVRFQKDGTSVGCQAFTDAGFCPGTTIEIRLRTDTIEDIPDETEDLEW